MIRALGGFFGKLFGTNKSGEKILDLIDKMKLTDQERADWALEFLKTSGGQNISRRVITLTLHFAWLSLIFYGVGMYTYGVMAEVTEAYHVSEYVKDLIGDMWVPVSMVYTFYYAPNKIGEAISAFKRGKTK
jgi:hypothetical protein